MGILVAAGATVLLLAFLSPVGEGAAKRRFHAYVLLFLAALYTLAALFLLPPWPWVPIASAAAFAALFGVGRLLRFCDACGLAVAPGGKGGRATRCTKCGRSLPPVSGLEWRILPPRRAP